MICAELFFGHTTIARFRQHHEDLQGYNAQPAANEDQVFAAASVTDEQNHVGQLNPKIEATEASLADAGVDDRPDELLTDVGYCSKENLTALGDDDPDLYVARNMKKQHEEEADPCESAGRVSIGRGAPFG